VCVILVSGRDPATPPHDTYYGTSTASYCVPLPHSVHGSYVWVGFVLDQPIAAPR